MHPRTIAHVLHVTVEKIAKEEAKTPPEPLLQWE